MYRCTDFFFFKEKVPILIVDKNVKISQGYVNHGAYFLDKLKTLWGKGIGNLKSACRENTTQIANSLPGFQM